MEDWLDAEWGIVSRELSLSGYHESGHTNDLEGIFEQYDRIATLHAFSRILVTPGDPPTADLTCTGALWAILDGTDQRVNLSSRAGDIHHLSD